MPKDIRDIQYRVFHLGPECYVIYLGSDKEDENPFLRIGNIPDIPKELHNITSRIIITSSFTGNPFQEVRYARKHKLSYLGDVDVIDHYRRFFESLNLPARELTDYRQIQDTGKRHTLYFYNNGNIHLNFDRQLIFDLQKREQADLHWLQKSDRIKGLLLKNPLRYTREELNKPAFFISDNGKFYLYHKEWMSLDLENRYFSELASQGIDPDDVHAVFTHVPEESMTGDEQESLVQHIKRRVLRNKDLSILTTRSEIPEHLIKLFPGGEGEKQSPVKPVLLQGGGKWDHENMHAEILRDNLLIRFGSQGDNVLFIPYGMNSEDPIREEGWHVSSDRKSLTWRSKDGRETQLNTLRGYPLVLEHELLKKDKLTEKYLGFLHSYLEAWKGRDSWQNMYELEGLVDEALDNRGTPGSASALQLDVPETPGLEYLFLSNVLTLLNLADQDFAPLKEEVEKVLQTWEKPSPLLPVLGDLYHGETGPFILYRISTHKLNPYNFRKAEEIAEQMVDLEIPDQAYFRKEKQRLRDLLGTLYSVQPVFTEVKEPVKKKTTSATAQKTIADSNKKKSVSPSPQKTSGAESSFGTADRGLSRKEQSRSPLGAPSVKKTGNSRKSLSLPILLLLLFLLLGGGGFGLFKILGWPSSRSNSPRITESSGNGGIKNVGNDGAVGAANIASSDNGERGGQASSAALSEGGSPVADQESEPDPAGDQTPSVAVVTDTGDPVGDETEADNTDVLSETGESNGLNEASSMDESALSEPFDGGTGKTGEPSGLNGASSTDNSTLSDSPNEGTAETSGIDRTADDGGAGRAAQENSLAETGGDAASLSDDTPRTAVPVVETETRPKTTEEALAYLQVEDIRITLVDIHLVSNDIAVRNGYHDLDYEVDEGNDPDWIWVGNTLVLPDGTEYSVVRGDTIWFIASRLIRRDIEEKMSRLNEIESRLDSPSLPQEEKQSLTAEMRDMAESTLSGGVRKKINDRLRLMN